MPPLKFTRAQWGRHGFTLVEIMIVVAIIGLLAAIAIPSFVNARARSQANACINNLRMISAACDQFAIEANLTTGAPVSLHLDLTPYIKLNATGNLPACPAGGSYGIESVGQIPVCSLGNTVTPGHVMP